MVINTPNREFEENPDNEPIFHIRFLEGYVVGVCGVVVAVRGNYFMSLV